MTKQKKEMKFLKLILLFLFILLMIFLTIKLFPLFKNLGNAEGRINFKNKIDDMGILGPLVIIGLIFIQLLVAFLPGEPLEILSGMCYGTWGGMVLIFIGVLFGSTIIFFSVRKFGKDFIETFFDTRSIQKLKDNKLMKNTNKLELIFFILFFLPGTPKDLFTYIGGLMPIKPSRFLLISTFARFPSIITSTFAGANIIEGNMKLTIITFIVTLILSLVGIFLFHQLEKQKITIKE